MTAHAGDNHHRLEQVRAELEARGAVVAPLPETRLSDDLARALADAETRRLRILLEAEQPGPAPWTTTSSYVVELVEQLIALVRDVVQHRFLTWRWT